VYTNARVGGRSQAVPVYTIRLARPNELGTVLNLIDGAAAWLRRTKVTTQWNRPWPNRAERDKRVNDGVVSGETWLLFDGDEAIGTVTIKLIGHEELWTAEERRTEAVYLHRLVVRRDPAYMGTGLGAELINWAGRKGRSRQPAAEAIRLDVWTENKELHGYYLGQGFRRVAIRTTTDKIPSGALFEKPMRLALDAPVDRITEADPIVERDLTARFARRSDELDEHQVAVGGLPPVEGARLA
jgi:ribosomal protein S18 acetylase RimI-like enzyme